MRLHLVGIPYNVQSTFLKMTGRGGLNHYKYYSKNLGSLRLKIMEKNCTIKMIIPDDGTIRKL